MLAFAVSAALSQILEGSSGAKVIILIFAMLLSLCVCFCCVAHTCGACVWIMCVWLMCVAPVRGKFLLFGVLVLGVILNVEGTEKHFSPNSLAVGVLTACRI